MAVFAVVIALLSPAMASDGTTPARPVWLTQLLDQQDARKLEAQRRADEVMARLAAGVDDSDCEWPTEATGEGPIQTAAEAVAREAQARAAAEAAEQQRLATLGRHLGDGTLDPVELHPAAARALGSQPGQETLALQHVEEALKLGIPEPGRRALGSFEIQAMLELRVALLARMSGSESPRAEAAREDLERFLR